MAKRPAPPAPAPIEPTAPTDPSRDLFNAPTNPRARPPEPPADDPTDPRARVPTAPTDLAALEPEAEQLPPPLEDLQNAGTRPRARAPTQAELDHEGTRPSARAPTQADLENEGTRPAARAPAGLRHDDTHPSASAVARIKVEDTVMSATALATIGESRPSIKASAGLENEGTRPSAKAPSGPPPTPADPPRPPKAADAAPVAKRDPYADEPEEESATEVLRPDDIAQAQRLAAGLPARKPAPVPPPPPPASSVETRMERLPAGTPLEGGPPDPKKVDPVPTQHAMISYPAAIPPPVVGAPGKTASPVAAARPERKPVPIEPGPAAEDPRNFELDELAEQLLAEPGSASQVAPRPEATTAPAPAPRRTAGWFLPVVVLLVVTAVGVVVVGSLLSSVEKPSEAELQALYPYGFEGARTKQGIAPGASSVKFKYQGITPCDADSGETCLLYEYSYADFFGTMRVHRADGAWRRANDEGMPFKAEPPPPEGEGR